MRVEILVTVVATVALTSLPAGTEEIARPDPPRARADSGEGSREASRPPFEVTELSGDVIVVTTEPYAANSLFVRTEDGSVILVDSPMIPADTLAILAWIEEN